MSSWQRSSSDLRASDAERERVVDFLRESALAGRITHDELDDRIGLAYAAVTRGDLERLLVDLPRGDRRPAPRRPAPVAAKKREASPVMVLVGLTALAIPMIVMAGVVVALLAVVAVGAMLTPFVLVALLVAAALRRRRPPGPGPGWRSAHYG
jgi:hypothetical protein